MVEFWYTHFIQNEATSGHAGSTPVTSTSHRGNADRKAAVSYAAVSGFESHCRDEETMETIIIEIRAAEGGDDAKLLVADQLRAYVNVAARRFL